MSVSDISHQLITDYRQLFIEDRPLVDLRAPAEFARGSFTQAVSLPLMSDEERAKVGTCYKYYGQQAAINLGHKLVSGQLKADRLAAWAEFARAHPNGALFCWRGGLRSQITQQWLAEAGIDYPRIAGGYKALRRFLIDELERLIADTPLVLLAGRTGCGKTELLVELKGTVDLEGLANHRGSSFGGQIEPQPTQIAFENDLSVNLLKQSQHAPAAILLEDESGHIGSLMLPQSLREKMAAAPVVILETPFEQRVENIFDEYIRQRLAESIRYFGEKGFEHFSLYLRQSLYRIRRRLGMEGYQQLQQMMEQALASHQKGDPDAHREWITTLLRRYYDPMYDYQLGKKARHCLYAGQASEVAAFWHQQLHITR
ncbi:tRNA 2-selenouridine synthase [Lacimicrobium alkaliphilum]|uniref:tRNA 2-selenouridine synthase n=1 Tax=Lacimicrobium alkaliphilum TaxID=1526571 RepID=A0ABQ1RJP2_9ALTE|nr:tRNA 2-selenouridine synthase [Lacimicrobium alkaliphilum]